MKNLSYRYLKLSSCGDGLAGVEEGFPMLHRVSGLFSRSGLLLAALAALSVGAGAQAPIALPYTATTVAGGGAAIAAGATCPANSQYKAADAFGNGCPGANVNFNADTRGGVVSDGQGNIFIADSSNNMVRKYDPKTGVVSRLAGKGTNCTTANGLLDSSGDGCPALQTSFASTPRGLGIDPYGNVLFAGYGTQMVHVICQAASPLCLNTTGTKQVGYMYRVAGCVATAGATATAGSGTTAGSEGDGTAASPYENLAGDVANNGGIAGAGTCSAAAGELNQPRGVAADKWGNVYIAETALGRWRIVLGPQTSSYFAGNNPLWAVVALNPTYPTPHQGYIYPLLNGFVAKTANGITYNVPAAAGGACQTGTGASSAVSTDAVGDGCQYFATAASANTSSVQGIAVDNYGNVIITDAVNSLLRVIYAGGANAAANPMYAAIVANNPTAGAPVQGFVYRLAGGASSGSTFNSAVPTLGSAVILSNGIYKVAIGPGGNIYLGDTSNVQALLFDVSTGYIRSLFKTGTPCAAHTGTSTIGDGCPANTFSFSSANGFGVAPDPLGNLYVLDQNALLRKVEAVSLIPTTVGSTTAAGSALTQTLSFHGPVGTASMTATAINAPADITVGAITCAAANADSTMDCTVPVTFAPTQAGARVANLAVTALNSSSAVLGSSVFPVAGTGVASALVTDVAVPTTTAVSTTSFATVALDGAGNVYTIDTSDNTVRKNGTVTLGTAPANPLQMSVDTIGNVYVTAAGAAGITKYTLAAGGTYTTGTVTVAAAALPQAALVDGSSNLYVADKTTGSVYEVPVGTAFQTVQPTLTLATGFTNPVGLALDGNGSLYVSDNSVGVFKITFVNGVATTSLYAAAAAANVTATPGATAASATPTVTVANLIPNAIAADVAGDVYVQDSYTKSTLNIPANLTGPATTTVLGGTSAPAGLAVDGTGAVYVADSGTHTVTKVSRNAASYNFGSDISTVFGGVISNTGNLTATGYQTAGQDAAEFPITSVSPTNCYASGAITPGYACSVTTQFTPGSGTGNVQSVLAYTAASSTTGALTLKAVKTGAAVTTTTTIGAQSPSSAIYASAGTEVSFPVTVTASDSSTATGTVNITVDATTPYAVTLSGGKVTVPLSGLSAGSHTITAVYPSQAGLTGSTSNTVSFTIAQATTTVSWSPGATTQQFSAAVGAGVLNATAVVTGTSTAVPGYYLYTATLSGGSTVAIHAASFLPVGTYSLGVTFVPTDSVDFVGSTAAVASYTVTKASTSAAVGASQMVVASDGTGNYTTVQAAINAIPATGGGAVYIKPGTYTGSVTVVQPNVSMRGLGGDPTAVVLTHSGGAFGSASGVQAYAGEFTAAGMNGAQLPAGSTVFIGDPGSSTLLVSKGVNTAVSTSTLTPNNFYGENFTVVNTYDSDTTTTTTTYLPAANSGNCTANQGPARTYNDLFNNSLLCASQALAFYSTSDLAVVNNMYATSLQDTVCLGSCGSTALGYPSRMYWFRGKITGSVDYIFGDGAAAFDYTSVFSMQNKSGGTGGAGTIHAQSKQTQIGAGNDYLSGFVMNSNVFTSQTNNTFTQFGRPYGPYSTWIMLNSAVDEVMPAGYIEFSGKTNLPTSTFAEYNLSAYTTPATGASDLNGVQYTGSATYSGYGVLSTSTPPAARETMSTDPGTPMASNAVKTQLTAGQATLYYPAAFLGTAVSSAYSTTANFNPTSALAANVNAFVPTGTSTTITAGSSITVLMRPQTPGLGAITNGSYTIPTGTYSLLDNGTVVASGNLDAAGEAYFTTTTLAVGAHNFTWTYGGDANFSGSTTSTALVVTVAGRPTTTTLGLTASPITYGQSATLNSTVSPQSGTGTPTGNVTATVDSTTSKTSALSSGVASSSFTGLTAGNHSFTSVYAGDTTFAGSTSTALGLTVNQATLTATGQCANRIYGAANVCSASVSGYQYTDSAATVFAGTPTGTGSATRISPAGNYSATPLGSSLVLTPFGTTNYTVNSAAATSYTVSGGAAQSILFPTLPNFAHGASYQLTAHATSGLPVTYTITTGGGIASVNGATLTVTGTGTVTVQANCTDASGNYVAAAAVSRTFTAQ